METREGEWLTQIERIENCPETLRLTRGGTNQTTLLFAPANTPTAQKCGWDHFQNESATSMTGTALETQPPPPKPKISINFGLLSLLILNIPLAT